MFGEQAQGPVLSDEETGALLDAMREDEVTRGPEARDIDLASSDAPLRDALARADHATTTIAMAGRNQLLRQLGIGLDVEPLPAEIVPRDVLVSAFDPHAVVYALQSGTDTKGLLMLDPGLAGFVLERSMGSTDEEEGSRAYAALSTLDRQVIHAFPNAMCEATSKHLLDGRSLALLGVDSGLEEETAGRFEPMLRLGSRFSWNDRPVGEILVALSPSALSGPLPVGPADGGMSSILARLTEAEVEIVAMLGRTSSCVRDLLGLEAGDVLRLDGAPGEPVMLSVDDVVVAEGDPVVHKGDLAIQIRHRYQGEAAT